MINNFNNKNILIVGAAGTVGSLVVNSLLKNSKNLKLHILDINEDGLFSLNHSIKKNKNNRVMPIYADINEDLSLTLPQNLDYVFNFAAYKNIISSNNNPTFSIKTNTFGTLNLIKFCIDKNVKNFLHASTDKAVNSTTVMGASKFLAEKTLLSIKHTKKTKIGIIRFGNILHSNGSVLDLWFDSAKNGEKKLSMYNGSTTRYYLTKSDCLSSIFATILNSNNKEIWIPKMKVFSLKLLADQFTKYMRTDHGIDIKIQDKKVLRENEKSYEELLFKTEIPYLSSRKGFYVVKTSHQKKQINPLTNSQNEKTSTPLVLYNDIKDSINYT